MNARPSSAFMNRNSICHDVHMNDVRMSFERLNLGKDWTPEWLMKSHAMRNDHHRQMERVFPDGIMVESVRGLSKVFAMELERTRKSQSRYEKIISYYRDKTSVDVVWYIARDVAIINAVIKAGRAKGIAMNRLWFCLEHEFAERGHQTPVWLAAEGKWTRFDELGFDKLVPAHPLAHVVSRQEQGKEDPAKTSNPTKSNQEGEKEQENGDRPVDPDPSPPTSTNGGKGSGSTGRGEEADKESDYQRSG